jgi:hypothetical protein
MAGDYHRYLSDMVDESIQKAGKYYAQAYADAEKLSPTSFARLGIANNYAVFCHEVLHDKGKARLISKTACIDAAEQVDTLIGTDYNECKCIIQVLAANFDRWSLDGT